MTGEELRQLRKAVGMMQYQVSDLLGILPTTLSRYERGHAPIPKTVEYAVRWICQPETPAQRLIDALHEALEHGK